MAKNPMTRKAYVAHGAIVAYMLPRLAQDAAIDFAPLLSKVGKTFDPAKLAAGVTKLVTGKLAEDADITDLGTMLEGIAKLPVAEDAMPVAGKTAADEEEKGGKLREFLKGKLSEDDMRACDAIMGSDSDDDDDEDDKQEAMDEDDDKSDKEEAAKDKRRGAKDEEKEDDAVSAKAMDAAIKSAVDNVRKTERAVRAAEDEVRPYIGKVAVTCDQAHEVYKLALDSLGIDVSDVHPSAYRAILKTVPVPGTTPAAPRIAADAKGQSSFHELFPEAKANPVRAL